MQPLVSIIVPCYNQAAFLDQCLQSVLVQTYQNWECLLINDGSTDKTEEIAKNWVAKDSRFKYFYQKNSGVSTTRNFGIEQSNGEFIQFLDGDDFLHPEKLQKSLDFTSQNNLIISNFDMLTGGLHTSAFCDLSKRDCNYQNLLQFWDVDFNLPIHTILIAKNLIGDIRFPTTLRAKEDWIFWLEIFKKPTAKPIFINQILATYRNNDLGASKNFKNVFIDAQEANLFLYSQLDQDSRIVLFKKINQENFELKNTNLDQKNYIKQLQNNKLIKAYLQLRKKLKF